MGKGVIGSGGGGGLWSSKQIRVQLPPKRSSVFCLVKRVWQSVPDGEYGIAESPCTDFKEIIAELNDIRPRSTIRLSRTIGRVATESYWSGPMKSHISRIVFEMLPGPVDSIL